MIPLMTTKEVAEFLHVNEKKIYSLISDNGLPATRVAGKWVFPRNLVEQWIENNTLNFPKHARSITANPRLIVLAGSNDMLLDRAIASYNRAYPGRLAVFGNIGSQGGIQALRKDLCHICASHLVQDDEVEYNFQFAAELFEKMPVVVNFCRRHQGLLFRKDNPLDIHSVADLGRKEVRLVNRSLGTGTRVLLDRELEKANLKPEDVNGYANEVSRHMDVGLEILAGRADVGPAIEPVAGTLGLGFLPLRWERYDLLVCKDVFFEKSIQNFFGLIRSESFLETARSIAGYDLESTGSVVFQDGEE
ncbi:MAG: substrate-binding domain-containing protein [Desulfovibrionaceae bacterium]